MCVVYGSVQCEAPCTQWPCVRRAQTPPGIQAIPAGTAVHHNPMYPYPPYAPPPGECLFECAHT